MPAASVQEALKLSHQATETALGVELAPQALLEALRALRDTHGYRFYIVATGIDGKEAIEVVHGLRNLDTGDDFFVKVSLPKEAPELDSAAFLYAGAEWHEREIFDLLGVRFRSHPDLRRILMPDEYEGHPLLKEFPMDTPWGYRPAPEVEGGADG
jgi:NADH-quinone oxidoreductase subunit C